MKYYLTEEEAKDASDLLRTVAVMAARAKKRRAKNRPMKLVGTGSWLGRDNFGLFATPDAVALVVDQQTGAARLIITKPESAAVIICDDENTQRPNKPDEEHPAGRNSQPFLK